MSIRFWLYAVVLGGCLVAGFASTGVALQEQPRTLQSESSADNRDPSPKDTQPKANTPDPIGGSAENRGAPAPVDKEHCENAKNDGAILNLCQQWRMANAAEAQVIATFEQNELTKVETTYLLISIGITGVATAAAIIAVWLTRVTARHELRAYLAITPAGFSFDAKENVASIHVRHENSGQTPARNVRFSGIVKYLQHPIPEDYPLPIMETTKSRAVIHPRQASIVPVKHKGALTAKEAIAYKKQRLRYFFFGKLTYDDVFGDPHETVACWSIDPTESYFTPPPDIHDAPFEYAECHNDAD